MILPLLPKVKIIRLVKRLTYPKNQYERLS